MLRDIDFQTVQTDAGKWRVAISGSQYVDMAVGLNMDTFYADVGRFRVASLIAVPIALVLLALGGFLLARRALLPVQFITQTAENVSATGLDQRVPSTRSDREFTELIDVINGMLERLEKSYSQAVRFSADAAHELNTPLTVLQGELEQGIVQAVDNSEDQRRCNALLEEVQADGARMIISNASAELLDLDSGKLFERFYRGDPSRTRSDKAVGSGLGLSLSREIARAHGGNLEVLAIADDQVTFCLTLPALRQAA